MTGNVIETVMGAVVLVVAAVFLFFAYTTSQVRAVQGYQVTAQFERVGSLRDGGDVRIAGVKIGSVVSETLDPKTFLADRADEHRPGLQTARGHGGRDRLQSACSASKYMSLVPGGGREDDPAGRADQIYPIPGQPGKPDRANDLFRARRAEEAGRGRGAARRQGAAPK